MDGKGRICKVCPPFAGERRECVGQAAGAMADSQARVFYDGSAANMRGGDPSACFEGVYCSLSCYCMIFSSRVYAAKMWPSLERAHAIARRIRDRGDYVLPTAAGGARVPARPRRYSTRMPAQSLRGRLRGRLCACFDGRNAC